MNRRPNAVTNAEAQIYRRARAAGSPVDVLASIVGDAEFVNINLTVCINQGTKRRVKTKVYMH